MQCLLALLLLIVPCFASPGDSGAGVGGGTYTTEIGGKAVLVAEPGVEDILGEPSQPISRETIDVEQDVEQFGQHISSLIRQLKLNKKDLEKLRQQEMEERQKETEEQKEKLLKEEVIKSLRDRRIVIEREQYDNWHAIAGAKSEKKRRELIEIWQKSKKDLLKLKEEMASLKSSVPDYEEVEPSIEKSRSDSIGKSIANIQANIDSLNKEFRADLSRLKEQSGFHSPALYTILVNYLLGSSLEDQKGLTQFLVPILTNKDLLQEVVMDEKGKSAVVRLCRFILDYAFHSSDGQDLFLNFFEQYGLIPKALGGLPSQDENEFKELLTSYYDKKKGLDSVGQESSKKLKKQWFAVGDKKKLDGLIAILRNKILVVMTGIEQGELLEVEKAQIKRAFEPKKITAFVSSKLRKPVRTPKEQLAIEIKKQLAITQEYKELANRRYILEYELGELRESIEPSLLRTLVKDKDKKQKELFNMKVAEVGKKEKELSKINNRIMVLAAQLDEQLETVEYRPEESLPAPPPVPVKQPKEKTAPGGD